MKLSYFFKRFREIRNQQIGKTDNLTKIWFYLDFCRTIVVHGCSINDYFLYNFYKLRNKGKSEYITYRKYKKIQRICNPDTAAIDICRNKIKFNTYFADYLGRRWLNVSESTYDTFYKFIDESKGSVFIKAIDSFRGIGVQKIDPTGLDKEALYRQLKKNSSTKYILEEAIEQVGEIHDFHPWSVNTIRIITVYDDKNDKVYILSANLRVGRNHDSRDNLHSGGIACQIDIKTGLVFSPGFDQKNELYFVHPDTHKQFIGFIVPYWSECLTYIKKIARKLPSVRYVGWDIVSKGDGSFILIEANDNADHDIQQLQYKGLWNEYKLILKTIESSKTK